MDSPAGSAVVRRTYGGKSLERIPIYSEGSRFPGAREKRMNLFTVRLRGAKAQWNYCPNNSGSVPFPANFSFFIEVTMRKKTGTRLSNEEPASVGAKISEDG